jgi:hypothetical protein
MEGRIMNKKIKILIVVMLIVTLIYMSFVVFVSANSIRENTEKKHPYQYGINLHFMAQFTDHPHPEWYTPEELGIELESANQNRYHIYISDPGKALPWMRNGDYHFFSIKYNDKFYDVITFNVTPVEPYPVDYLLWGQVGGGVLVAGGWCIIGVIYWREKS